MPLKEELRSARESILKQIGGVLNSLRAVAVELKMTETAEDLSDVHDRLNSDAFTLIVLGGSKSGKSALLNALAGRITRPVAELDSRTTASLGCRYSCPSTVTRIRYAEKPYVVAWGLDEKYQEWSLSLYFGQLTGSMNEEEMDKFLKHTREIELGLPLELCQAGVTLIDTPETGGALQAKPAISEVIKQADAAIFVCRAEDFAESDSQPFMDFKLLGRGPHVFTVVNVPNDAPPVEELKKAAWNRLVRELRGGPEYTGQSIGEFTALDIYFVNMLNHDEDTFSDVSSRVDVSGLKLLETRLAKFLLYDRQPTHLEEFLSRTHILATSIAQMIEQRKCTLQTDEQQIEHASQLIQPQLTSIRARQEKLPNFFEHRRLECERELSASFEELIARLGRDMPNELKARPLASMKSITERVKLAFRPQPAIEETLELCNVIVAEQVKLWAENPPELPGVQMTLTPIINKLFEDIRKEVAAIDQAMIQIHISLTGKIPSDGGVNSLGSLEDRVISKVVGLLPEYKLSGFLAAGGTKFRAIAGALAGKMVAVAFLHHIGFGAVGLLNPLVLIPAVLAALAAGSMGLEDRIKTKVWEEIEKGLLSMPTKTRSQINQEVGKLFKQIEVEISREVVVTIEAAEKNIQEMMELNQRRRTEKGKGLADLDKARQRVIAQLHALEMAMPHVLQAI
ncbi:MAG: dynamin family protein [Nitrospira sp.]|nr:dynamin family protein [Nitrospira sp.]